MEKNALLAVVLSVLVLLGWYMVFPPQRPTPPETSPQEGSSGSEVVVSPGEQPQDSVPSTGTVLPSAEASQRQLRDDAQKVTIDTPLLSVIMTTEGARILEWKLKEHNDTNGDSVNLVSDDARRIGRLPLEVFAEDKDLSQELNSALYRSSLSSLELQKGELPASVSFSYVTREGLEFVKTLTFSPNSYKIDVSMQFDEPSRAGSALSITWGPGVGTNLGLAARFVPQIVSKSRENAKVDREQVKKIEGLTTRLNIEWAAIDRKYFTSAIFPRNLSNTLSINKIVFQSQEEGEKLEPIRQTLIGVSQALQEGACELSLYAGPKEYARLSNAYPGFEQLIDYGTFWFIAKPLAAFITFLYGYVHNYGLVIICLTILIKIVFYPLTHKSYQSMQKMQDLQPKLKALQAKHKDDKQAQQQAMMGLYKEEGVNPMGGCLPMLLQIPVFFALYKTLLQSIELRGAAFLWISDLSAPEPAFLQFIKPLVLMMGASMFIQQSMTPTAADNKQAQMFKFMPILFTAMFWNFPSGLVLYWFMNNLLTVGQQYLIKKRKKGGEKFSKTKTPSNESTSSSRKRRKKGK